MSFVLIVFGTLALLDALWWWSADYAARRLAGRQRLAARVAAAAWALAMLGVIGLILAGVRWAPAYAAAFLWHLIVLPVTLLVTLVVLLGRRGVRLVTKRGPTAREEEPGPTRRAFLVGAVAAPPAVTLAAAGVGVSQLDDFRVRRIDVPIAGLPPELDGFRIAHVSDTHVGTFTNGRVLREVVDRVNAMDADLVAFTGDLINRELRDLPEAAEMVRALRGRLGVLAVEGNHDLMEGRAEFRRRARDLGVDLLVNERRELSVGGVKLDVLGAAWPGERSDRGVRAVHAELPPPREGAFPILLAHHPHAFDPAREGGVPLTLAGHTHGGQLMLPGDVGFGPLMYRYWSGLYQRGGAATVISNGTGNWFPLRTFAPAEVGLLTLRRSA